MTVAIDLLIQLRDDLETSNNKELALLVSEYARIDRRIGGHIEAFVAELATLENPTKKQIQALPSFQRLLEQVNTELIGYTSWMKGQLQEEGDQNVGFGGTNSLLLLGVALAMAVLPSGSDEQLLALGAELSQGLNSVNDEVVERLLEFLNPNGVLFQKLEAIPGLAVDKMVQSIKDGVLAGLNPETIGRQLTIDFGLPLTDSLRMMRTLQLWSYREANRANFLANGIDQWIWYASLDATTCLSCINQHGTIHPVTESLDDHHNGRCTPLPFIEGVDYGIQNGTDWWASQSDEFREQSAGPLKFQSLLDGITSLSDYSVQKEDDVYGTIRFEQSQKQVLITQGK